MRRRDLFASALAGLPALSVFAAGAVRAGSWQTGEVADSPPAVGVDHTAWGHFLGSYRQMSPEGTACLDYGAVTAADRTALRAYVRSLERVQVSSLPRNEQFAFWMNLYNALIVELVLDHYPIDSVRDIGMVSGSSSEGPWAMQRVTIEGKGLSPDDIEHRIVRPGWKDCRIHYGFNCATLGGPNLTAEPFLGRAVDDQLDAAAVAFINHPRGVRIEPRGLATSSLYHWYRADFGGSDRGVIRHLMTYAAPRLAMRLQTFEHIADHSYDWRLNDVKQWRS
jgi:hypothetical protein